MEQQSTEDDVTIKKVTLKELQNTLPIHIKGKNDQSFTFKDWGMDEEQAIAKLKTSNMNMGLFVSEILCTMLETLNGENFSQLELKKRKLLINQQFAANILYIYLFLRYDQIDDRIRLTFTCPYCDFDIKDFIASLNDLDVDCKCGDFQETIPFTLNKKINLDKGNQVVEVVKLGLSKWDTMEKAKHNKKTIEYDGMRAALLDGIKGVEGIDTMVNITDIVNKLRKRDMLAIHSKLTEVNAGPDLTAEVTCDQCDKTSHQTIDWSYDGFFGISSLPLH